MTDSSMPLWLYVMGIVVFHWVICSLLAVVVAAGLGLRAFSGFMMKRYPGPPEQCPNYRE